MNDTYKELSGAKWIGRRSGHKNPMSIEQYVIKMNCRILSGETAGIVFAARNRDNYMILEHKPLEKRLMLYDVCDNAWDNAAPSKTLIACCNMDETNETNTFEIRVKSDKSRNGAVISVICGGKTIIADAAVIGNGFTYPLKYRLMLIGFRQINSAALYSDISVNDIPLDADLLAVLGEKTDNGIKVENTFSLSSVAPCFKLRRNFEVKKAVKRAVLFASARGFYNAYANGGRIGKQLYAPGFTDYRLRIQYQEYDISGQISVGMNEITVECGSGYYAGFAGYNLNAGVYGDENSFIARIHIEYLDGTSEDIYSDESWECSGRCAVMYADYLQGEYYDARFDTDNAWRGCDIISPPRTPVPTNGNVDGISFAMEKQAIPGAHEVMRIPAVYKGEFPEGHRIYDLGQNIFGTVKLTVCGSRGTAVKLHYGEMCLKSGEIYLHNLRSAACTDTYVLKGEGDEIFIPDLTGHGFRYVEICTDARIKEIVGIAVSDIDEIRGSFECSEPLINQLYSNIIWGQRDNFVLVPTDCPQRNERMGWTGDAQVFARTAAYNMDIYAFMRKWLKDMREAQLMYNMDGAVPDIVPLCGDNRGGCAGWADAAVIVPWELYMAYGRREILEENYEMMKAWVDFQNSPRHRYNGMRTVDGEMLPEQSDLADEPYIQPQQRRGDHLTFDPSTPFILTATAYAAHCANLLSKTAGILGRTEDEKRYSELFGKIKSAFNEAWVQPDGTIAYWGEMSFDETNKLRYSEEGENHPSQTAYAVAIDFGLIEVNDRGRECFKRTVEERGGCLSTGFLGISHLAPALSKCGLTELAFSLLEQEKNPGWLYSVINGATTIWERWNSYIARTGEFGDVSMNSFNHYSYGAIGEWMFSDILGIAPAEAGYKALRMTPHFGGKMKWAKGWHISPQGIIKAGWRAEKNEFIYEITLPDGAEAQVIMPDGTEYMVSAGKHRFVQNI